MTGLILLGFAVAAYILFYWSYIPRIGFEHTVHLQFDNVYHASDPRYDQAGNPYGTVKLGRDVVNEQRYDVWVELMLPRTPNNQDAGNFMLEASMHAPGSIIDPVKDSVSPGAAAADNHIAFARRPGILSYRSPAVEYIYKATELPWYLFGLRKEAEKLSVAMFEGIEFARGWRNVPATLRLELQSSSRMQVYSAKVLFKARFRGLRWLMYNHRIISAVLFIGMFWTTELVFAGVAWAALSFYLESPKVKTEPIQDGQQRIKQEDDDEVKADLSDTERTFPSSSRQPALRYESPSIKDEEDDGAVVLPEAVSRATEADDEDEDADDFRDSGLGTSLESGASRRDSVRRRRGRLGSRDGLK